MSASIIIEQESGTFTRSIHRHNGYYAGHFSTHRVTLPSAPDPLPAAGALLPADAARE
jgi:hypothetical protein